MTMLTNAGKKLIDTLEKVRVKIAPFTDKVLDTIAGPRVDPAASRSAGMRSFELEADAVMSTAKTHRAQTLVRTAVIVMVVLITWAALAPIDEVTKGDAKVIPSKQLQVIQSLDGGIVSEILVKEGQVVEAGQMLLKIDETRATSGVRESAAQTFALQTKLARLKALAEGQSFTPPTPRKDNLEEQRVVEEERQLYDARRSEFHALVGISEQQLEQREQELTEAKSKRDSATRSLELSQQELTKTRPLLATGAVSEVEILRLERDVSRARGDTEQATAQSARALAAIAEARRKIQETELSFRNEARKELSETALKLNSLSEGGVALADRVDKAMVRSPVKGTINRILVNTVGGVVQPGKEVVEIVPLDDALLLEARIAPKDIGFLAAGQPALVKFTAYDFSIYGGLEATVDHIASDTVTDEKGNAFYVIRVRTQKPRLAANLPVIPGMVAEVDVKTGKKSVLSYLLKPVLRAKSVALTER